MKYDKKMFFLGCVILLVLFSFSSLTVPIFVTKISDSSQVILIDPGHGGNDPGKVGSGDVKEKDINLSLGKRLKKLLEKNNFKVYMTRNGDYNLASSSSNKKMADLTVRKEQIFNLEPVATISIHQNSYPSSEIKGAQVFYHQGSLSSKNLADSIQTSLIRNLDKNNHRQSKANTDYYLLRDNPYPTVIVECGFLSNEEEKEKLQSSSYQQKAAQSIYEGLRDYLSRDL